MFIVSQWVPGKTGASWIWRPKNGAGNSWQKCNDISVVSLSSCHFDGLILFHKLENRTLIDDECIQLHCTLQGRPLQFASVNANISGLTWALSNSQQWINPHRDRARGLCLSHPLSCVSWLENYSLPSVRGGDFSTVLIYSLLTLFCPHSMES